MSSMMPWELDVTDPDCDSLEISHDEHWFILPRIPLRYCYKGILEMRDKVCSKVRS